MQVEPRKVHIEGLPWANVNHYSLPLLQVNEDLNRNNKTQEQK